MSAPQRILLIKPSSLGDVVHALPVLAALRHRWPDAHISWLVTPACAGLLEGHPLLDQVILFQRRRLGRIWRSPAAGAELADLSRSLRHGRFDLVIDLQGLFRSGWLAWQSRARCRVGLSSARELAWVFYTHRVAADVNLHAVDRNLRLAAAVGCPTDSVEFPLHESPDARQYIDSRIPPGQPIAVLLPGANWLTKRWPASRFAELVDPLHRRHGLNCVTAGGPETAELAAEIPAHYNLSGQTTLPQLVALLRRADLVIANDSGPLHIAAALGRPLVAVFGPTSPQRSSPYRREDSVVRLDMPCSPCFSRRCSHRSCLRWLEAQAVLSVVQQQLARHGCGALAR